jgi:hypothetical protein
MDCPDPPSINSTVNCRASCRIDPCLAMHASFVPQEHERTQAPLGRRRHDRALIRSRHGNQALGAGQWLEASQPRAVDFDREFEGFVALFRLLPFFNSDKVRWRTDSMIGQAQSDVRRLFLRIGLQPQTM